MTTNVIRIVAALVIDDEGRVLLVRKRGTRAFMQPGGKLEESESHVDALHRELNEELSCSIEPESVVALGTFTAPAANEAGLVVEAALYRVKLVGTVRNAAEIDAIVWLRPEPPYEIELAALTKDTVLPLARAILEHSR